MRWCFFLFLVACQTEGLPPDNSDLAMSSSKMDLAMSSSKMDLASEMPKMCISTCNRCAGGGCCGTECCKEGEWCDATQHCRCGMNAGCTGNLICSTGGPFQPGASCGFICCGDAQHPCPL